MHPDSSLIAVTDWSDVKIGVKAPKDTFDVYAQEQASYRHDTTYMLSEDVYLGTVPTQVSSLLLGIVHMFDLLQPHKEVLSCSHATND